ncbi:MAG: murein L,D-transpeptidase catalytic domain family protein [Candidatus Azobacteroides sp.]|nr:murein L,D-transpeptidase catalytic domain family protein [Candidatus Azobacteroides sp.]
MNFHIHFLSCLLLYVFLFPAFSCSQSRQPQKETSDRLKEKAIEALEFCRKNGYNTDFCILVDMKVHSGKYRMFVWNFEFGLPEHQALCAHGCGKDDRKSTGEMPLFSNVNGSLLTSLGKYKLGVRSYSQYGINVHYKMHGLEPTNSNAFKRIIVLHSHTPLPEKEIYPAHLPMGWSFGCPVTDDATMTYLDKKLKLAKKPVVLWIYY